MASVQSPELSGSAQLRKGGVSTYEDRRIILPIRYPALWKMYLRARDSIWMPREVVLDVDVIHWAERLTDDERHALSRVLSFFATADGVVADNLVERFSREVPFLEAKYFYGFQAMMENIHAETYALILHRLIPDDSRRRSILEATEGVGSVAAKNRWAKRWLADEERPFSHRLVAFACVEGIFFSSSFAVIYWFKERNLLPGLCYSNDLISRDEALHTDFATLLLKHLDVRPLQSTVVEIVGEAVDVEVEFVTEFLPRPLPGLSPLDMITYVQFVSDQLLNAMGYDPLYRVKNPFPLMHKASIPGRTNFFERKNADYRLPAMEYSSLTRDEFTSAAFARG